MPQTTAPTASLPGHQVGALLKELREGTGDSLAQVCDYLNTRNIGCDTGTLSRIENGRRRINAETATALLDRYGADPDERNQVLDLISVDTTRRRRPGLWRRHSALISGMQFEPFLTLERKADWITTYQTDLIPGLLQTRDYARQVLALLRPNLTAGDLEGLADLRMSRQKSFAQGRQRIRALICQRALTRSVGDPAVMHEQLQHLLYTAGSPRHDVRILPYTSLIHPGATGPFVILGFDETTPDLVCVETMTHSVYFEGEADVRAYTEAFSGLWDRALAPGDPTIGLEEMIKEQHP
ncbi:helix-turn-helix domain-containing protein [Streptomyces sp. NPDC091377]|uniref:helix-turn-helix domain-containing protein n=1 Tax=Streptomyces sp. NPDC091377 TaxID=3365995 RepID=UPI0037F37D82